MSQLLLNIYYFDAQFTKVKLARDLLKGNESLYKAYRYMHEFKKNSPETMRNLRKS